MKFGGRIRALRRQRGMTLRQVGAKSGLSTPFLSQVERDKVSPAVASLAGIAKALGVSMSYFVEVPAEAGTFRTPREVQEFKLDGGAERIARLASRFEGRQLEPLLVHMTRHPRAMPQYNLGHLERVETIRRHLVKYSHLYLTGIAYDGVGIPDCIHGAETTADALLDALANPAASAA